MRPTVENIRRLPPFVGLISSSRNAASPRYNGYLTLPSQAVIALRLPFAGYRRGTLADGSVTRLDVYLATVFWHGQPKDVLISQTAGTPLIGMSLLEGSRMTMDVADGGHVSIDELP